MEARVREIGERVDGVDRELVRIVAPLSKASVAAEADGLIVEPHEALCDAEQAPSVEALMGLRENLRPFAEAMGREVV